MLSGFSPVNQIADWTSTSLESPSASTTYVNSAASITANTSGTGGPKLDVVDGTGVTTSLGSSPSPQTVHSENQIPPVIPARSSSNSHLQRDSKASGKAGSRSGSVASSRRLKKARTPANIDTHDGGSAEIPPPPVAEKPKKRGVSKFLSILNCCSAHENANQADESEKVMPADQAEVLRQMRENQTIPVAKPNASAGNSSADETKEADGENMGGPPYPNDAPPAEPQIMSPAGHDAPAVGQNDLQTDAGPHLNEKQDFSNSEARDEPLPAAPTSNALTARDDPVAMVHPTSSTVANEGDGVMTPPADLPGHVVGQPTTVVTNSTNQPEMGDTDTTMVEAAPTAPIPSEHSGSQDGRTEDQFPISLPPPPPRTTQIQAAGGVGPSSTNAAASNERPAWLLPPLHPRFRGKKCLVLDLDETLVHSSFKVCLDGCINYFRF